MKSKNIFEFIPKNLENEVFENIVSSQDITIERIISKGHTSPTSGWHNATKNEWVLLIQGEAELLFENGETVRLQSGNYLNITAGTKHKVSWTVPDVESIWLAVHY